MDKFRWIQFMGTKSIFWYLLKNLGYNVAVSGGQGQPAWMLVARVSEELLVCLALSYSILFLAYSAALSSSSCAMSSASELCIPALY